MQISTLKKTYNFYLLCNQQTVHQNKRKQLVQNLNYYIGKTLDLVFIHENILRNLFAIYLQYIYLIRFIHNVSVGLSALSRVQVGVDVCHAVVKLANSQKFSDSDFFYLFFLYLHAVSRMQRGRRRKPSVKTLYFPLSTEFWKLFI